MRALVIDARKGSVFQRDVVFVASYRPFDGAHLERSRRAELAVSTDAFGDTPGTRTLSHDLVIHDYRFAVAQLHRHLPYFE